MRNITLILSLFLSIGFLSCQEQEEKVPESVKKSFRQKYPGENDPDWEKDDHGYWESHFKIDGEKYRADFNADGSWVETENDIKKENLPEAIKRVIKEKYSDLEITEVEHVTHAKKGEFYDVEFKKKEKNMDVMFRADGTEID
ncbi:MAG: PepSY-like domain-containing protein [Gramella sp.]|nr:PepSY-like domain-containing protein [Christiangramia sp.]